MQRWQYLVQKYGLNPNHDRTDIQAALDAMGNDGWELVSVVHEDTATSNSSSYASLKQGGSHAALSVTLYLRRPIA